MFNWENLDFWKSKDWESVAKMVNDLAEKDNANQRAIPGRQYILRALDETSFEDTKVVILGQDPYPTPGHANGLAFSVDKGVTPIPPSLRNIFKEYQTDLHFTSPRYGDLTPWAKQGVLLLNTCLTTLPWSAGAHIGKGWESLAREILVRLAGRGKVVFVLWGRTAQQFLPDILPSVDKKSYRVILSAHPSPLSASKGFFGSRPFTTTNKLLRDMQVAPIDWRLP